MSLSDIDAGEVARLCLQPGSTAQTDPYLEGNMSMRNRRTWTALTLSVLTASAALTAAPTASAGVTDAAACTKPSWSNKSSGYGYTKKASALRTGPSADCSKKATASGKMLYHCYYVNSSGNTWTHARISGTQTSGWIYDKNLSNHGAQEEC